MLLGVTGVFGCGKSTLMSFFAAANWRTFDADACCHDFYNRHDKRLISPIVERWGTSILDETGGANRKKIAEKVFNDDKELKFLEGIILPLLNEKIDNEIKFCRKNHLNCAFEIPKLFEAGYEKLFDGVVVIWTPQDLRVKRLKNRGFEPDEIARRDAKQFSPERKLELATYALINSGSTSMLQEQFIELINYII